MDNFAKFNKKVNIFRLIAVVLAIAVLVYLIATLLTRDDFDIACIVAVSVFCVFCLTTLVTFILLDRRMTQLADKCFGKVTSTKDMENAKRLLLRVKQLKKANYSFIDECEREEFYVDNTYSRNVLKSCLKTISNGHKIDYRSVEVYFKISKEIETAAEKELQENRDFNLFIKDLTDLFENTTYRLN